MRLALFVFCKNTFSEGFMGKHCLPSAPDIGAAAMSRKLIFEARGVWAAA